MLKPLAGTGPSGYRNEYLQCLTAVMTDPIAGKAVERHCHFAQSFVNAELPAWYYWLICATTMIALIKKEAAEQGGSTSMCACAAVCGSAGSGME